MKYIFALGLTLLALLLAQCNADQDIGEELLGGTGTVFNSSSNAFGLQHPLLNEEDALLFFSGNSIFNQSWVAAPASSSKDRRDGLGPLFNATSCSSCHLKDGRGRPPMTIGEKGHGLLIRLAKGNHEVMGPIADKNYGTQLQDQSIEGVLTEADFSISYDTIKGSYADGMPYQLIKPKYHFKDLQEGEMEAKQFSPRVANQIIGMGLLEAISPASLLALADEEDKNGDGISGKLNYVWDIETQSSKIGRFGWKANQPNVQQQVAGAFSGDMGITSSLFPKENCPPSVDCKTLANGGNPEISDEDLDKVTIYASALAVPARRDWEKIDVQKGKQLFAKAKCNACHISKIETGEHPRFKAFSNQTIRPYTDLLLHDMGEGLADHMADFLANGREWRTQPLWGIGLFKTVNEHTFYLHDGRARNLEEAILWHGGEATASKDSFLEMNQMERHQLIEFLNSL